MHEKDFRIVFMGTPGFATPGLEELLNHGFEVAAVVTSPDRPAGRGLKLQASPVKRLALEKGLPVIQPENLKDPDFLARLRELKADLFVVVAFRILPESVWSMPPYGTFNLHASLLPQYRGAAPINHVLINGESRTGVTTFYIDRDIDTGRVIGQMETPVSKNETAGELHDRLMMLGARLVVQTTEKIMDGEIRLIDQKDLPAYSEKLKKAPKITREFCEIDWSKSTRQLYDFVRGLSPYPAAYTHIEKEGKKHRLKIFRAEKISHPPEGSPGQIHTDQQSELWIHTQDGALGLLEVQLAGKKRMPAEEFLRGTTIPPGSHAL